jgi:hypothetical protein
MLTNAGPAAGPLVICPACPTPAAAPDRFCQSCGAALVANSTVPSMMSTGSATQPYVVDSRAQGVSRDGSSGSGQTLPLLALGAVLLAACIAVAVAIMIAVSSSDHSAAPMPATPTLPTPAAAA